MKKKVNIISLGCSKNLVDTEMLLKQLQLAGYATETDVEQSDAEVVIVNTCGFFLVLLLLIYANGNDIYPYLLK